MVVEDVVMPRRTFSDRHRATEPPASGAATIDAIVALHYPVRRRLHESLSAKGPAQVGVLARRCGVAVGSASYHLGVLHRSGFVEPAPELARDTRESWWRSCHLQVSWTSVEYPPGTAGRAVLELAARERVSQDFRSVLAWMDGADELPSEWAHAVSTSALVPATSEQLTDFCQRLSTLVDDWVTECIRDSAAHGGADRRGVRVIARAFPSAETR